MGLPRRTLSRCIGISLVLTLASVINIGRSTSRFFSQISNSQNVNVDRPSDDIAIRILPTKSSYVKSKDLMVIDCFPYNGEQIVPARLAILNPYVDIFFISEHPLTFSGEKKERLFKDLHADVFKPYEDKIIWINTDGLESQKYLDAWGRERAQRNAGIASIQNAYDSGRLTQPFFVIGSDSDEIPNPSIIQQIMPEQVLYDQILDGPVMLRMQMFYYNFNWLVERSWNRAYIVNGKHLLEKKISLQQLRAKGRNVFPIIDEGGWHCSYCMSTDDIINKLHSFSHQEYNKLPYTSREHVNNCVVNGKDLFLHNEQRFEPYDVHQLPETLQEFNQELIRTQIVQ